MGKEMRMIYDDEGDVLDVSLGVPVAALLCYGSGTLTK